MNAAVTVRVGADGLFIDDLAVDDPAVLEAARRAAASGDLAPFIGRALQIGVTALTAVNRSIDVERLEQALVQVDTEVSASMARAVEQVQHGVDEITARQADRLVLATTEAVSNLSAGVQRLVSGQDGLLARSVRTSVEQLVDQTQRSLHEVILTQARATQDTLNDERERVRRSVEEQISRQHIEVRQSLDGIRERLVELDATKRARATSSARGDDFEESAKALLARIANATGDLGSVEFTGRKAGADGSLKGDIVVTVSDNDPVNAREARVVLEAKDHRSSRMSIKAITAELRKCRTARQATCSVAIMPPEAMPVQGHQVVLLEPRSICVSWQPGDGDELVIAAFQLMKLLAISEAPGDSGAVNAAQLRSQLEELHASLEGFTAIQEHLGRADKALERIRTLSIDLRADLIRRVARLHHTVLPDGGDADQPNGDGLPAGTNAA